MSSLRSLLHDASQRQSINYKHGFHELSSLATDDVSDNDAEVPQRKSTAGRSRLLWYRVAKSGLRWWLPELFASLLSVVSFIALVALVHHYEGKGVQDLNLPASLTLNGLVALLSTLIRAALMVPVASALSQEALIWFSRSEKARKGRAQLSDLESLDAASRGAWGSFLFLLQIKSRYFTLCNVSKIETNTSLVGLPLWPLS